MTGLGGVLKKGEGGPGGGTATEPPPTQSLPAQVYRRTLGPKWRELGHGGR